MKKQILTDNETKRFLAKAFGVEPMTVWRALTFKRDNELARKIRKVALGRGGVLAEGYVPECETEHDTAGGVMRQMWGPRVTLTADCKTGEVVTEVDGKETGRYHNLTVAELMRLQRELEQTAKAL